jgi:SAM-dependent methyltransferase
MFYNILQGIAQNKSLVRTLMNLELKKYKIYGEVLDIGGGINPSYFNFLQAGNSVHVKAIDGKNMAIDFEKDKLPAADESVDCVLMFNILEHIYNHNFLVQETFRVIKKQGLVLGFVPFLINYHPDPHDYFRYTEESLRKIFNQAGFTEIEIKEIGGGPLAVNYNNIIFAFPRIIRLVILPFYYFIDRLLTKLKPGITKRYPLGYMLVVRR